MLPKRSCRDIFHERKTPWKDKIGGEIREFLRILFGLKVWA